MKSPRIKLALAFLAMFLLGAVSGIGLFSFGHFPFREPPGPEQMQNQLIKFLTSRLNLTTDEQARIKPIAADFAQKAEALREQSDTQFRQLCDATDDRIALLITPEQKVALDKVRQERNRMMQDHCGSPFFGEGGAPPEPAGTNGAGAPPSAAPPAGN